MIHVHVIVCLSICLDENSYVSLSNINDTHQERTSDCHCSSPMASSSSCGIDDDDDDENSDDSDVENQYQEDTLQVKSNDDILNEQIERKKQIIVTTD
jgi:hypothetical protein